MIDDDLWHLGVREKCATESSVEISLLIFLSSNQWKLSAWKPGLNKHPTTIFEELCVKATYQSKVFDAINCYHTVWVVCALSHWKSVKLGSSTGPRFFPTCFNEEDILMWACSLCVSLRNTSRPEVSLFRINVFEHTRILVDFSYLHIHINKCISDTKCQ